MVVLDSTGGVSVSSPSSGSSASPRNYPPMHYGSFQPMQYVQPLPTEYDEKCDPLAMLTRACNKIETDLMKSHSEHGKTNRNTKMAMESPRSSAASDRPDSSSPSHQHGLNKAVASTSPIDYKMRASNASPRSSTTLKRPASTSSSASAGSPPAKMSSSTPTSTSSAYHRSSAALPTPSASSPRLPGLMPSPIGMPPLQPLPPSAGGMCVDPMCRDPSCPTTAARNAQFLNFFAGARGMNPYFPYPPTTSAAAAAMLGLSSPPTTSAPSSSSQSTNSPAATTTTTSTSSIGGAHVCNWMSGGDFCGRRFSSSDDLMSHLRSHTNVAAATSASANSPSSTTTPSPSSTSATHGPSPADTLAALQAAQLQALYPSLGQPQSALAALQARAAAAASSSLSPNSAATAAAMARYHPYMRPGGLGLPPPPGLPPSFQFGQFSPYGAAPSPFMPYGLPPFPFP